MSDNESMDKLSNVFDTTFEQENVEKQIQIINEKKQSLIKKTSEGVVLQNQKFLEVEIKSLIMSSRSVLQKLEDDIKVGTNPRSFEVYAKLLEAVLKQYQELRELNKLIYDVSKEERDINISKIGKKKISLDATQLLDLVDKAREKSLISRVDAKFEIENEDSK